MMRIICLSSLLLALLCISCWTPTEPVFYSSMRELTESEIKSIQAGNSFGIDLFREMSRQESNENLFISPLSISMALGMALNGARGETYDEMRHVLKQSGLKLDEINEAYQGLMSLFPHLDRTVTLDIANSAWYRRGFQIESDYLERLKKYFEAEIEGLDFSGPEAVKIINNWVSQKTKNKIDKIIDVIDPLTMLYLINAVYFKGTWTAEFDPKETQGDHFTTHNGYRMPVKMMQQENDFRYFYNDRFQAVDLPYGDGLFSMTILLPHEGIPVDELANDLTEAKWNEWMDSFPDEKKGIKLLLPRFTLEYRAGLVDVLYSLGMKKAFNPFEADFSGISSQYDDLHISDVIHKTYLKINEEGTEAAAVTAVVIGITSAEPGIPVVRVDRPFILAIREHHSGSILFIGKVHEPESD
jgi:serine protease inhibitor